MSSARDRSTEQLDDVLNKFDWKNAYFVFLFLGTSSVWLFAAMSIMVSSFTVGKPCNDLNTTTCSPINGTIAWEFDLNGPRARLADISTAVYGVGSVVGAMTLTRIADLKGRRPIVLISLFLSGLFGCLAAWAPNIYLFMAARFVQGTCFVGCAIDSWVLAYETVPKRLRDLATLTFGLMWVVGYLLVSPVAYFIRSWRILLILCSLPCLLASVAFYWLVPESFRFMVLNEQKKELRRFIQRANQFNRPHIDVDIEMLIYSHRQIGSDTLSPKEPHFLKELWSQKKLLLYTVVLSYLWLYNTFVYYGLSLFSTDLGGNDYANYIYLGLVEIPANVGSPYLLSLLGRKLFILGAHLIAAIMFFISIFIRHSTIALIFWLIAKSATVCSFNSLFVCASELFPTTIRSGCIGICEIMARVGGAISPLFHSLEGGGNPNSVKTVYAIAGFLGSASTLIIPETSKLNLPDTTSELTERER